MKSVAYLRLFSHLALSTFCTWAFANNQWDKSQDFLNTFKTESSKAMNSPLQKFRAKDGSPIRKKMSQEQRDQFWEDKQEAKEHLMERHSLKGPIYSNDNPVDLVTEPEKLEVNFYALDRNMPKEKFVNPIPWDDDYWPTVSGKVSKRYLDPKFPNMNSTVHFADFHDYYQRNPSDNYVLQNRIRELSPAEKYDLLVGDKQFTLTQRMWKDGLELGQIEPWFGLCHGWAVASMVLPRPQKTLNLTSIDGQHKIDFYPSDIKALGTLAYSHENVKLRFVGGRCNVKNPQTDRNGRVLDYNCFDNNPATFHMALLHQIAKMNKPFIMDASFDYEVWNQPIVGYQIRYFNPQSLVIYDSVNPATVGRYFSNDRFYTYRSPYMRKVVGVSLWLYYVAETAPSDREYDGKPMDSLVKVNYHYDLELDDQGNILGGEWYTNLHPDFLWIPVENAKIKAPFDDELKGSWDALKEPQFPEGFASAKKNSQHGTVATPVMESLFQASHSKP